MSILVIILKAIVCLLAVPGAWMTYKVFSIAIQHVKMQRAMEAQSIAEMQETLENYAKRHNKNWRR